MDQHASHRRCTFAVKLEEEDLVLGPNLAEACGKESVQGLLGHLNQALPEFLRLLRGSPEPRESWAGTKQLTGHDMT